MKPFFTIILSASLGMSLNGGALITASPASCNFAKYPANQQKKCTFDIVNTGNSPLRIEKIRTSCGCTSANISDREIAPGCNEQLVVSIPPEGISGPFSHGIFIHSNADNEKIKMLTVSGEACPLAVVLPSDKLYLGTLKRGTTLSRQFILNVSTPAEFATPTVSGCPTAEAVLTKVNALQWRLDFNCEITPAEKNFSCIISVGVRYPKGWKPIKIVLQGRTE